jgi:hypothetical protein
MRRTRKRSEFSLNETGHAANFAGGNYSYPVSVITGQETIDDKHYWPPFPEIRGVDLGGSFDSTRYDYADSGLRISTRTPGSQWRSYTGPQLARYASADFQKGTTSPWYQEVGSDDFRLFALGGTAIARSKPTSSVADAAVFLGELKHDGLPAMFGSGLLKKRTRAARFRALSGEYLNVEFGWKPLMSDLQKFSFAVSNSHQIVRQANRNSGKIVRRRYAFPVENELLETTDVGDAPPYPALDTYLYKKATGKRTKTVTRKTETWFSGAFTYHLATPNGMLGNMLRHAQLADKLVGFIPTPERVWQISPWSWAADWFANTGDVLSNMSDMATQGLVMHHGYIMQRVTTAVEYTAQGAVLWDGTPLTCTQRFTTTVMKRRHASPFGFGLTFTDFSPWQLSIMAALGMSHKGSRYHAM